MKNYKYLRLQAEESAKHVKEAAPKDEHSLIKTLSNFGFDGFTISKRGGRAHVYGEFHACAGNRELTGWTNFFVPSCRKFYRRDKNRRIINIEYFK